MNNWVMFFFVMPLSLGFIWWVGRDVYILSKSYITSLIDMRKEQKNRPILKFVLTYLWLVGLSFIIYGLLTLYGIFLEYQQTLGSS